MRASSSGRRPLLQGKKRDNATAGGRRSLLIILLLLLLIVTFLSIFLPIYLLGRSSPSVICQNGGTLAPGNVCVCPSGFNGTLCELNIPDCPSPDPCLNGGVCADGITTYTCECTIYFAGALCETPISAGLQPTLTVGGNGYNVSGSVVNPNFIYYQFATLYRPNTDETFYANETPDPANAPPFSAGLVEVTFPGGPPQEGDLISHLFYDGSDTGAATLLFNVTMRYSTIPSILIGFDTQLDWTGSDYAYYPLQIGGLNGTVVNSLAEYLAFADAAYFPGVAPRASDGLLVGLAANLAFSIGSPVRVGRPDKYFIFTYHIVSLAPKNQVFHSVPPVGYNAILPITDTGGIYDTGVFSHNTDVDWGDGSAIEVFGITTTNRIETDAGGGADHRILGHDYNATGVYTIRMAGYSHHWSQVSAAIHLAIPFGDPTNRIGDILQWGNYLTKTADFNCLAGGPHLSATPSATDAPNPSITKIDHLFEGCATWDLDVSTWSLPLVTSAKGAFAGRNMVASVASLGFFGLLSGNGIFNGATFGFAGLVGVEAWTLTSLVDNGIFRGAILSAGNLVSIPPGGLTVANQMFRQASIADFSAAVDLSGVESALVNIDEMFAMATFTVAPNFSAYTFASAVTASSAFSSINNLGAFTSFSPGALVNGNSLFALSSFPLVGPDSGAWVFPVLADARFLFYGVGGAAFTLDATTWVMSSVTDLSDAFALTTDITTLDVTLWSTASLTRASRFISQSSVAALDISPWITSGITNFEAMFQLTTTNVTGISTIDTGSGLIFDSMFHAYSGSEIDVSSYSMALAFTANSMFLQYIQGVGLSVASWTTTSLGLANSMFSTCNGNPAIGTWSVGALVSADHFVSECFISQANYDDVLIKLDATGIVSQTLFQPRSNALTAIIAPPAVLQFYTAGPSAAATAHASLLGKGWTLVDGGPL